VPPVAAHCFTALKILSVFLKVMVSGTKCLPPNGRKEGGKEGRKEGRKEKETFPRIHSVSMVGMG